MSLCPNFTRTQFLGAGIVRYNGSLGWGGSGGTAGRSELQVEVVEDDCNGGGVSYSNNGWGSASVATSDAFNPPQLGKPVEFNFSTFRFGGILSSWNESDGARKGKTYLIKLIDPGEILEGSQVICKGYGGQTFNIPNLYNIYGWLEESYGASCPDFSSTWYPPYGFNSVLRYTPSLGYGGAWDLGGLPWFQIRQAVQSMTGGQQTRFGGLLEYRSQQYYLDLSELPNIDPAIKLPNDSYTIMELITEICELAQYDFFVELASHNVIKIRTSSRSVGSPDGGALNVDQAVGTPIDNRLNLGVIGSSVGGYATPVTTERGIEFRSAYVNAFMTGEFRKDIWQIQYSGGCDISATIWPYWGKDNTGAVVVGQGCATQDLNNEHWFIADCAHLGLPFNRWVVDTTQLRAAAKDETSWRNYVIQMDRNAWAPAGAPRNPSLENMVQAACENLMERAGFIAGAIRQADVKPQDFNALDRKQMEHSNTWDRYEPVGQLYKMVRQFANEYFGQQFLVKLPYLCKKVYAQAPNQIHANWDKTDAGWFEGSVLGLSPGSVQLEAFREDDGKIRGFVYVESANVPLDIGQGPNSSVVMLNPYQAYVACEVLEIIHGVNGNFADSRAVIKLSTPVYLRNTNPTPEPYLLAYVLGKRTHNWRPADAARAIATSGFDRLTYGLPGLPLIPLAAAVPLQSTVNCYGPWAASIGGNVGLDPTTAGKTNYSRNTTFAPWEFGSMSNMNLAGDVLVAGQLTDRYVEEKGSLEIADAPRVSLGDVLFSNGSEVSNISVNFAQGSGAVTTRFHFQLYSARFGKLANHYVTTIKRNGLSARAYRRFYMTEILKRYQQGMYNAAAAWGTIYDMVMVRVRAHSSHDTLNGEYIPDPENSGWSRCIVVNGELRQLSPSLQVGKSWSKKASMDMCGMFRPFATASAARMPNFQNAGTPAWDDRYMKENTLFYTKEQVPPIFCKEHHMPIVMETLSPFLQDGFSVNRGKMAYGSSFGHDIEYVARDGVYPTHMNVRQAGYSANHDYRAIALKGPLVIAGWGFDTDNKPVPNAGGDGGNTMFFEDNWLRKPHKWKCGPVDLRWDNRRKVWTAPAPFKIVKLKTCGPLVNGGCCHALMYGEDYQYDKNGGALSYDGCCSMSGPFKVTVYGNSHRSVVEGSNIMAFYDTTTEHYQMINHDDPLYTIQILSDIAPGSTYGTARIMEIMGDGTDLCDTVVGSQVIVENILNQPLCQGQLCISYMRTLAPLGSEYWCGQVCPTSSLQTHVVLQATFRPLNVVTWVELIECVEQDDEQTVDCTLTGYLAGAGCYCTHNFEISCSDLTEDWVEYDICVKDRQIWLQTGWSDEKAWSYQCQDDGAVGGQAQGGSPLSDGNSGIRPIDCYDINVPCYDGGS